MKESIDWKRKLTSRKLWAAICSLVTNLIVLFGGTEDTTVKVTALIMAGASVIAYIIGEGLVDAANKGDQYLVTVDEPPELEEEIESEELENG